MAEGEESLPFQDKLVDRQDIQVRLPVFEGPLDLLLFLIRRQEIDIYDIPIAQLTRQYLEVVETMKVLRLEVAGEFFVMAATLMEIKSRYLLPRPELAMSDEEDDASVDPRWELVHQLLEYKKFKDISQLLEDEIKEREQWWVRPPSAIPDDATLPERPLLPVETLDLWSAFNAVLRRLAHRIQITTIDEEKVSVSEQMELVLSRMEVGKKLTFSSFLEGKPSIARVVATFLAILELTRLKKLVLEQNEAFDEIFIEPSVDDSIAS